MLPPVPRSGHEAAGISWCSGRRGGDVAVAARAQQGERVRRVGALMNLPADDQEAQLYMAAFQQGLQELGWTIGRNLRLDHRWGPLDLERLRQRAEELVALAPDAMIVAGGGAGEAVQRVSRTVPIVLAQSIDPVGAGFVASLARPGGNITGFTQFEYSLAGKWLQLLKEIAPNVTNVGVVRDTTGGAAAIGQWAVIQAMTEQIGVELTPISIRDVKEMERGISEPADSRRAEECCSGNGLHCSRFFPDGIVCLFGGPVR